MGRPWKRWLGAAVGVLVVAGIAAASVLSGAAGAQIAGVVSAIAALAAAIAALFELFVTRNRAAGAAEAVAQKTLEQRLDDLAASMRNSAQIVQQVSTELEARAATAKRLKEEAETAEAISRLHKEESEAVRRMLDAQLETATRKIRSDSLRIGVASFVAGGGVSFLITLLVHPIGH